MFTVRKYSLACASMLLLASVVGGCAEGDEEPSGTNTGGTGGLNAEGGTGGSDCVCTPGASVSCTCPNGGTGTQVCQSDCMSYSVCSGCGGAAGASGSGGTGGTDAGGSGGTGGSAGASGSGGGAGTSGGGGSGGGAGSSGSGGGSGGDVDVCPGDELVLTGSGEDPRTGSVTGDTSGLSADYVGSCGTSTSNDAVYMINPDVDGRVSVDLGGSVTTNFDSVLYVRTDCADQASELQCDDTYTAGAETLEFDATANTPYYIFVDGYTQESGPYTLNVTLLPKGCGNGIQEPGEDCDDGNDIDDDWCHNDCTVNPNPVGDTCPGVTMAMTGTGLQNRTGKVTGDTTNLASDYGGDYGCGYGDTELAPDAVIAIHSDVDGTLECDTGGATATPFVAILTVRTTCDDSDSELYCDYEYSSMGAAEITELPVAENQDYYVILDGYEQDDYGAFELNCQIIPAYCGNDKVEGTEQCDDGNNTPGDGCDADCNIEPQGPADVCPGQTLALVQSGTAYIATMSGETTGQTAAYAGSCGSSSSAPEQVYQFNSAEGGNVTVSIPSTGTDFDTVLYVREGACFGPGYSQIDCKDGGGDGGEEISFQAPPNTDYWVFVDGYSGQDGNYRLEVTVVPTCGDGTLDVGEACDDGNKTPGDGCSASCQIEAACASIDEAEPNPYDDPTVISASCGTFQIPSAALTPSGDGDHFMLEGLIEGAEVDVVAFVGSTGSCTGGTDLVVSLWRSPISSPGANIGSCAGQAGAETCEETPSNGNCAELNHTVSTGEAGDYIIKVHSWATGSTVPDYGLIVMVH